MPDAVSFFKLDHVMALVEAVHARLLGLRVGIANIPLEFIDMHPQHRPANPHHISRLKEQIVQDPHTRWAHPIDLVAGNAVTKKWLKSLKTGQLVVDPPTSGRFWCIAGQHRVLAARALINQWEELGEEDREKNKDEVACWPATIYESSAMQDEDLSLWMIERNVHRVSLKVTLSERLAVLDGLEDVDMQKKALGLLGWSAKDAACMVSIRQSAVWDAMMAMLAESLYEDVASGTLVDWAIEYRAYPILAPMLLDLLQQQRQLRLLCKNKDERITMDFVFGLNSVHNQQIKKTGTEYAIGRIWGTGNLRTWDYFDVSGYLEFWRSVTRRTEQRTGLEVGSEFLYGRMIPSIHDINFHSSESPFADRIHRCELAASLLHILFHHPKLISLPARRPRRVDQEVDWVQILDPTADRRENRSNGDRMIVHLLSNLDKLVPAEDDYKKTVKVDTFPHMRVLTDPTLLVGIVDTTMNLAWEETMQFATTLGFTMCRDVLMIRRARARGDVGSNPSIAPTGAVAVVADAVSVVAAVVDAVAAVADAPVESQKGEREVTPVRTAKHRGKKRIQVLVRSPGGTLVEDGYIPRPSKRRHKATPEVDELEEDVAQEPSSQSVVEYEDEDGGVWDGYRLHSSPSRARPLPGGLSYIDPETRRIIVARDDHQGDLQGHPERKFPEASEMALLPFGSAARSFVGFATKVGTLTSTQAEAVLHEADVDQHQVEDWYEKMSMFVEDVKTSSEEGDSDDG